MAAPTDVGPRSLAAALTAMAIGLFTLSAVAFPAFRAPDEPSHVDRVRSIQQDPAAAVAEVRLLSEQVRQGSMAQGLTGSPADLPPLEAGEADDRPFEAFAPASEPSDLRNQMTQHPPAYYALVAVWTAVVEALDPGPASVAAVVLAMRLAGVALVAAVPALCVVAARRAGLDRVSASAAGVAILAVPMLAHIAGSVSNDTLLVLVGAVLTVQLMTLVHPSDDGRPPWAGAAAIGAAAAVALLTKGFALVVLGWVPLALLLAPITWRQRIRDLAVITAVGSIGLAWWVRNLVVQGTIQPDHASLPVAAPDFAPDAAWWVPFALRRLVQRFWVEPDIAQDLPLTGMAAAAVLALLLAVGSVVLVRRREHRVLAVLGFPVLGMLGVMAVGAWQLYVRTGAPFGIHGRYLYPALPGLAVVVAAALSAVPDRWRRAAVGALLVAGVAYQARVLLAALTFYWGDVRRGPVREAVEAAADWVPLSPLVIGAAGLLAVAGIAGTALAIARLPEDHLRPERHPSPRGGA